MSNGTSGSVVPRRVRRGAIGILGRGREYLVVRRAEGIAKGGYWCFPGGHVEPGETSRQAVCRELAEELGLDVRPASRLGSIRVLESMHVLVAWRVVKIGGELRPARSEIAETRWLTPSAIRNLEFGLVSNLRVLQMLGV